MTQEGRERWDARYRAEEVLAAPSPFLTGLGELLPRQGRALDVAGGSGRHALWLARRGLEVTLADISPVALDRARREAARAGLSIVRLLVDLERDPLPAGPWDLIVCVAFLHRPLLRQVARALAQGGLLVFEHPTRTNLTAHPRPGPAHLLEDGEAPQLVADLDVIRYEERWSDRGHHLARLLARKGID